MGRQRGDEPVVGGIAENRLHTVVGCHDDKAVGCILRENVELLESSLGGDVCPLSRFVYTRDCCPKMVGDLPRCGWIHGIAITQA